MKLYIDNNLTRTAVQFIPHDSVTFEIGHIHIQAQKLTVMAIYTEHIKLISSKTSFAVAKNCLIHLYGQTTPTCKIEQL